MPRSIDALLQGPGPLVVGVLNITPDSFSDGGRFGDAKLLASAAHLEPALAAGRGMQRAGADIVEVGGESTAPGRKPVDPLEEQARIADIVEILAREMAVSVDTYHKATAALCLAKGASFINDVSALRAEPDLARVVAEHRAGLVLMHAKDGPLPHVTPADREYHDVVAEVACFLLEQADLAAAAGVREDRIVVDPGASSFLSHNPDYTWELLREFDRFVELVHPFKVMIATSRKGFYDVPLNERDPLSQLTALVAAGRGAHLIRTHNPAMAAQFIMAGQRMGLLDRLPD